MKESIKNVGKKLWSWMVTLLSIAFVIGMLAKVVVTFRCELSKSKNISEQEQLHNFFLTGSPIKCDICDAIAVQKVTLKSPMFGWDTIPDDPYNYSEHNLCNKCISDKRYEWFLFSKLRY